MLFVALMCMCVCCGIGLMCRVVVVDVYVWHSVDGVCGVVCCGVVCVVVLCHVMSCVIVVCCGCSVVLCLV